VVLVSIVLSASYTELKYSGSEEVLRKWLKIILAWVGESDGGNPGWLYSVLTWKVNSRNLGVSNSNSICLAPVYEILRFVVIYESRISEDSKKDLAQLTHALLTSIRAANTYLKKPGSKSINSAYEPFLPIVTQVQYEKILEEMVKATHDSRTSMNRLAQVTAVALAQGQNVIMPASVRQSAKKLPMQNTTLLEIVTNSS
jgi:hypothetical protein